MCLMCDPTDISRFVTAGNATFTLSSRRTGAHYTFKCSQTDNNENTYFLSLLTGPDNTTDFQYIGLLNKTTEVIVVNGKVQDHISYTFRTTSKSRLTMESMPVKAFLFFCGHVINNKKNPSTINLEFRHEGRCGRCNRKLTVPESLDTGLGPECADQMGVPYGKR